MHHLDRRIKTERGCYSFQRLVMNNPICLSLLPEPLVLHAHTHTRSCHRSPLKSLGGSREGAWAKDKEWGKGKKPEMLGVSCPVDKHREVELRKRKQDKTHQEANTCSTHFQKNHLFLVSLKPILKGAFVLFVNRLWSYPATVWIICKGRGFYETPVTLLAW